MPERLFKILLIFFIALFCLSVGFNNIVDYDVNFQFLSHVVSMDAMKPWFDLSISESRSITNPSVHAFLYTCIITAELSAGLLALLACLMMIKNIKDDSKFLRAKYIYLSATAIMITVWYFGFNVIGVGWFYMWASQYDAQATAYNFVIFLLISLMYVMRRESI